MNKLKTELETLSYEQLVALHNLNRYDFKNKEQISEYLIRKWQEESGHLFIKES